MKTFANLSVLMIGETLGKYKSHMQINYFSSSVCKKKKKIIGYFMNYHNLVLLMALILILGFLNRLKNCQKHSL